MAFVSMCYGAGCDSRPRLSAASGKEDFGCDCTTLGADYPTFMTP